MPKHQRTRAELEQELDDQLHFLRESARLYDQGSFREAKRLATYVYTLLHDGTGRTESLLRQLNIRSKLSFISTARQPPEGTSTWIPFSPPLTVLQMSREGSVFVPNCQSAPDKLPSWSRQLSFAKWWDEPVSNAGKRQLSRKGLIWIVRSRDGGAHVDGSLNSDEYVELIHDPLLPGTSVHHGDGTAYTPANSHWASVRQIAWELDYAIKQFGL